MRDNIKDALSPIIPSKGGFDNVQQSRACRRYGCDPRTIDRYLKIQSGELIPRLYFSSNIFFFEGKMGEIWLQTNAFYEGMTAGCLYC